MDHPFNRDLQNVLDADEAYDFLPEGSWLSGGCGLLAEHPGATGPCALCGLV